MLRSTASAAARRLRSSPLCLSSHPMMMSRAPFTDSTSGPTPPPTPNEEQAMRDALRVLHPSPHTRSVTTDAATSAGVWPMKDGIYAEWVHDALGYHIPVGQRESPRTDCRDTADSRHAAPSDAPRQREGANSGSSGGSCSSSPFFYGPTAEVEMSPVFEWHGCLWQWRPLEVRTLRDRHHTQAASQGDLQPTHRSFYLVPFLLLPTAEVAPQRPWLSRALRDAVLHRHAARLHTHAPFAATAHIAARAAASLWSLTVPTPVGRLAVAVADHAEERDAEVGGKALAVFAAMERRGGGSGGVAASSLSPPSAGETWATVTEAARRNQQRGAQIQQSGESGHFEDDVVPVGSSAGSYVHVFTAGSEVAAGGRLAIVPPRTTSTSTLPPFSIPSMRRNVLGGGVAELLLAIDNYAALMARDELTLSAACWATLCDTRSAWAVQRLRRMPLEVEGELVVAAAAHRRWQRRALMRHHTMVGKSSIGLGFDEYPVLASWGVNGSG